MSNFKMFLQICSYIEPMRTVKTGHFVGDAVYEAHMVFEGGNSGVAFTAVGAVAGACIAGATSSTPHLGRGTQDCLDSGGGAHDGCDSSGWVQ